VTARCARALVLGLSCWACWACGGPPKVVDQPVLDKKPEPPPAPIEWPALAGSVKAIDVVAQDATLGARIKELLAAELGKPVDRRRLRGELAQVLALKGVADVTASGRQLDDGVALVIEITAQPALHALVAREVGGEAIPLPGQLAAAIGLPVDPGLVDALADQLRTQYLAKGYTDVAVAWKQSDVATNQVDVTVEVTPGKASTITTVEFKGNAHAKKADLVKAIGDGVAASSPWNIDQVERASLLITAYYYDHGYVNVAVQTPKPSGTAGPAVFTITEGDQFRIGKLEITGVSAEDSKKYLALAGAKKGDVFSRTALATGIGKIQDASKLLVTPLTTVDTKKKTIDLKLEVSKP
jgi:outer membrane protein insertion porin family